jgi:hypothetical protein
MAINVIEGARRISMLAGALWLAGVVFLTLSDSSVHARYQISFPEEQPSRIDDSCPSNSADVSIYGLKSKNGTQVVATLCFLGRISSDGSILIPYRFMTHAELIRDAKEARELGDENLELRILRKADALETSNQEQLGWDNRYSSQVTEYMERVRRSFALPEVDEAWIDEKWWLVRKTELKTAASYSVAGLASLWGFTWAVGWIVRGFMGIPKGSDRRLPEK